MKKIPYRLAEALEKICKTKSLETITVSQIAIEAGVTRQVFYHHFDDKFELASWIHYVHLFRSVKEAVEKQTESIWRETMRNWMHQLKNNKEFYVNAFQSVSQKEFQRIIKDFFFHAYKWHMTQNMQRNLTEEESYVLRIFLFGTMEVVYEWIASGMTMSPEGMVEIQEKAMPQIIKKWITTDENVPYKEALKEMEKYILKEGLIRDIS